MYETADSIMRNGVKYYNNFDAHSYLRMSPLLVSFLRFPQQQKTMRSTVFSKSETQMNAVWVRSDEGIRRRGSSHIHAETAI